MIQETHRLLPLDWLLLRHTIMIKVDQKKKKLISCSLQREEKEENYYHTRYSDRLIKRYKENRCLFSFFLSKRIITKIISVNEHIKRWGKNRNGWLHHHHHHHLQRNRKKRPAFPTSVFAKNQPAEVPLCTWWWSSFHVKDIILPDKEKRRSTGRTDGSYITYTFFFSRDIRFHKERNSCCHESSPSAFSPVFFCIMLMSSLPSVPLFLFSPLLLLLLVYEELNRHHHHQQHFIPHIPSSPTFSFFLHQLPRYEHV